jgi:hypothetical protein
MPSTRNSFDGSIDVLNEIPARLLAIPDEYGRAWTENQARRNGN